MGENSLRVVALGHVRVYCSVVEKFMGEKITGGPNILEGGKIDGNIRVEYIGVENIEGRYW